MTTDPAPAPVPQPFLHGLVSCVRAPSVALSGPDGQIRGGGTQGLIRHDCRVLAELRLDIDGHEPVPVGHHQPTAYTARFVGVLRHLGDPIADPTVRLERSRRLAADGVEEGLTLVNAARAAVAATVRCRVAVDFATIDAVKHGAATTVAPATVTGPDACAWTGERAGTTLHASGGPRLAIEPDGRLAITWQVELPPRSRWHATVTIASAPAESATAGTFIAPTAPVWPAHATAIGPGDLVRLLERSLEDLTALTLTDRDEPRHTFLAAGSPWFFTLFGRDSLWAARLTLPLGTDLAGGTLRALARRQGTRHDPETAEAPGKIPHEVRQEGVIGLPAVYYGTVDATALWVCLLHDAWRWGLPAAEVTELLDPLAAALRWLLEEADSDGDGFLEYADLSGHGLANQGWKDSEDAIQFPDGTIATPPIALSEAQAYAYQAGMCGAALLRVFNRPGAERVQAWARRLRARFREAFWVEDARGRFPAIALDGAKRPVDVASSNLGHLLGTGLLDPQEAAAVAHRLAQPDLDSGHGLHTLSRGVTGFNPLGYHTGTVWPHDTAIAVQGLVRDGYAREAASLAQGLLRAASRFDYRLPELFAGTPRDAGDAVLAYPAACRPQAWSAAAVVALLQSALGLAADLPAGKLTVQVQPEFAAWFPLRVDGLRLGRHPLSIEVDPDGRADVRTSAEVELDIQPAETPRVPGPRPRSVPEHTG